MDHDVGQLSCIKVRSAIILNITIVFIMMYKFFTNYIRRKWLTCNMQNRMLKSRNNFSTFHSIIFIFYIFNNSPSPKHLIIATLISIQPMFNRCRDNDFLVVKQETTNCQIYLTTFLWHLQGHGLQFILTYSFNICR